MKNIFRLLGLSIIFMSAWNVYAEDCSRYSPGSFEDFKCKYPKDFTFFANKIEDLYSQLQNVRNQISTPPAPAHHIGELYQGGIIFWLDVTNQHGLIVAKIDASREPGVKWANGGRNNKKTNALADGINAGNTNTALIVAKAINNKNIHSAALMAANFKVAADGETLCHTPITDNALCFGGWYLPSAYELTLLFNNMQQLNLAYPLATKYWSSTEATDLNAWEQDFITGELAMASKDLVLSVRPIKSF